MGLTGYFRKFVVGYGEIACPLTQQLKKDAFGWMSEVEKAFRLVKRAMTTVPVLALPDFSLPFVIEADASGHGIGAVLMQNQLPIAYFSQVLSNKSCLKSVYERELVAIVLAIQKWRHYVLGHHFIVRTDQRSLKYILEQRVIQGEFQRWVTKLMGYDFEIQYRLGIENKAADALSRISPPIELSAITYPFILDIQTVRSQVDADPQLSKVKKDLQADPDSRFPYALVKGNLLYKGRLVLPPSSSLIPTWLHEFHRSTIGGHYGSFGPTSV